MYTINDFLDGKIVALIHNQRQWNRFIDFCEKYSVTFGDNKIAKDWTHNWKRKNEVILCRTCWDGHKVLTWQFADELPPNVKKVHVNELLCPAVEETGRILKKFLPNGFPKPEPKPAPEVVNCRCVMHTKEGKGRFRIIVDCDGDTTTARMLVDGRTVKKATAKRNSADEFRIGAQTAFERLWEKKKKPVVLEVKRHAKPGEWVKIVNATNDSSNEYENGDVLQIVRYTGDTLIGYAYYRNKQTKFLYDKEYVVLEGYKPE